MRRLEVLDDEIDRRAAATALARTGWPCRAGCDDCCRSLAALPELTAEEWARVEVAVAALPTSAREAVAAQASARRGREAERPIECPLLDRARGMCRVYGARPIACRTYGFYADRDGVLGCAKIATVAEEDRDVVWGNHDAVLRKLTQLAPGPTKSLLEWLVGSDCLPRAT